MPARILQRGGSAAIRQGLAYLAERAGGRAGATLASFFDDLPGFAAAVAARTRRPTLLQGDTKPENLGLHDGRLVAVDWGELTGVGPAELDVVRFAFGACGLQTDMRPAEAYERYSAHASVELDDELLALASLSCMANNGLGNLGAISVTTDATMLRRSKDRLRACIDEFRRHFDHCRRSRPQVRRLRHDGFRSTLGASHLVDAPWLTAGRR